MVTIKIGEIFAKCRKEDSSFLETAEIYEGDEIIWGKIIPIYFKANNDFGYAKFIVQETDLDFFMSCGGRTSSTKFDEKIQKPKKKKEEVKDE